MREMSGYYRATTSYFLTQKPVMKQLQSLKITDIHTTNTQCHREAFNFNGVVLRIHVELPFKMY